MKFSNTFSAIVAVAFAASQPAFANVVFNVAPAGASCGSGTTITCFSPSPSNSCKGNFNPKQASIVVTQAQGNCHISLYPQANQQGGVIQRLNTDTTGTCVFTGSATWASYGVFCD
ncbi:hypothetical protein V5O48_010322 [Marasmius crinis-equi]|uniref:Uncharacterized protein n=1 Tax=Marasmius crinis-equi TaxID=585013 RepID=A0ABR3F8N9_9AGAR